MSADGERVQYNLDCEKAILAAVKGNNSVYDTVNVVPDYFYDQRNRKIFVVMKKIIESGKIADDLTMAEHFKDGDGMISYMAALDNVGIGNVNYYVDTLRKCFITRKLKHISRVLSDTADDPYEALETLEKEITGLSDTDKATIVGARELYMDAIMEMENASKIEGDLVGITSGFRSLDRITTGFQPGELIIMGARPSIGKTALALTMAIKIAKRKISCGFFSLEMSNRQIGFRLISSEAKVDMNFVRTGKETEKELVRILDAGNRIATIPLFILDTRRSDLSVMKSMARKMKREKVKIIFIDYLTLISYGNNSTPRHERVGQISKQLKSLAEELDIPIVVLSQITRSSEGRMPGLDDLRQSGEIEEDSDCVIFLHRKRDENETDVCVAKNRNGPTGSIKLAFLPQFVRFEETSIDEAEG